MRRTSHRTGKACPDWRGRSKGDCFGQCVIGKGAACHRDPLRAIDADGKIIVSHCAVSTTGSGQIGKATGHDQLTQIHLNFVGKGVGGWRPFCVPDCGRVAIDGVGGWRVTLCAVEIVDAPLVFVIVAGVAAASVTEIELLVEAGIDE